MAKPYSYDLRQKVLQAIKLDGLKKSEASQLFNISRNTIDLWLKRLEETGDSRLSRISRLGMVIRLLIGRSSVSSLPLMGIKPKLRWQNFGRSRLAISPFHGHSRRLASREKKDLWLSRTR